MCFLLKRFVKTATEPEKEGHDEKLRLRRSQLTPQKRSRTLRWNGYCTRRSVKSFRLVSEAEPLLTSREFCVSLSSADGDERTSSLHGKKSDFSCETRWLEWCIQLSEISTKAPLWSMSELIGPSGTLGNNQLRWKNEDAECQDRLHCDILVMSYCIK